MSESSKSTLPPGVTLRNRCQPSSILEERNDLGLPLLLHAVADAANLGYNFLNVSGDEPLRYPWLAALCREAHKHGMLTSMISRSMALTAPQLEWLRFSIDLLGIEVDGKTPRASAADACRAACRPWSSAWPWSATRGFPSLSSSR